jgi:hypothetical protein
MAFLLSLIESSNLLALVVASLGTAVYLDGVLLLAGVEIEIFSSSY